jgi:hypothetical protein
MSDTFHDDQTSWKVERSEGGPGIALGTDTAEMPYGAGIWFYGSTGEIRFLHMAPADLPSEDELTERLTDMGPTLLRRSRTVIPAP